MKIHSFATIALTLATASAAQAAVGNLSFQNGFNSYTSQVNILIDSRTPNTAWTQGTTLGVDGYVPADNSPDIAALIRFDNIFGSAASQVPAGATITNARLVLTSQSVVTSPSAESSGPWGVSALLSPFTTSSTYSTFAINTSDTPATGGNRGPWYQNGTATRPLAGVGIAYGTASTQVPGLEQFSINITPFAQAWSKGTLANNGVVVQAGFQGLTDGWIIRSGSHGTLAARPTLQVAYTTDPVSTVSLKQGVNGYTGTTMALERYTPGFGGAYPTDGSTIVTDLSLDLGSDTDGNPSAAIKFDNIASFIPEGATLINASVVITTSNGTNSRSPGVWRLDKIANTWDLNTLSDDLSPNGAGPQGELLTTATGMINGSEALFDVTSDITAILAGTAVNNGWVIRSAGTGDGWNIWWTGAEDTSVRPELRLTFSTSPTAVPEPAAISLLALAPLALRRRR